MECHQGFEHYSFEYIDDMPWSIPPPRLIGNLPLKFGNNGCGLVIIHDETPDDHIHVQESRRCLDLSSSYLIFRWFVHDDWIKRIYPRSILIDSLDCGRAFLTLVSRYSAWLLTTPCRSRHWLLRHNSWQTNTSHVWHIIDKLSFWH